MVLVKILRLSDDVWQYGINIVEQKTLGCSWILMLNKHKSLHVLSFCVQLFREYLLENDSIFREMSNAKNPFGDGLASLRIMKQCLKEIL